MPYSSYLMVASALFMGVLALLFSFFPQELLAWLTLPKVGALALQFQLLGALYGGFAMLNWMGKENPIGGIYNRPVAMGNFAHFMIGALALLKGLQSGAMPGMLWPLALAYTLFAIPFGLLLLLPARP